MSTCRHTCIQLDEVPDEAVALHECLPVLLEVLLCQRLDVLGEPGNAVLAHEAEDAVGLAHPVLQKVIRALERVLMAEATATNNIGNVPVAWPGS